MSIEEEAVALATVIGLMCANEQMTFTVAPELAGRESELKEAINFELSKIGMTAAVVVCGRRALRAST